MFQHLYGAVAVTGCLINVVVNSGLVEANVLGELLVEAIVVIGLHDNANVISDHIDVVIQVGLVEASVLDGLLDVVINGGMVEKQVLGGLVNEAIVLGSLLNNAIFINGLLDVVS